MAGHQKGESGARFGELRFTPAPLPANVGLGGGFVPGTGSETHQTHPVPWSLSCH